METISINKVEKGWGYELIFANNNLYCGKILHFNKDGKCSSHFHKIKDETWYVYSGKFTYKEIITKTGDVDTRELIPGDIIRLSPFMIHQLICIDDGDIFEVSTPDDIDDSYRVSKGDSQL